MCGALCASCTACCAACFRVNKQMDACCLCIPLRVGALLFAGFYLIVDVVLVILFAIRYHDDPFSSYYKDGGSSSDDSQQMPLRLEKVVDGAQPCVLALIIFFAALGAIEILLLAAVLRKWQFILQLWVCLSAFRGLHVVIDLFLIILTCILLDDPVPYLYPNFVAMASLVPLAYARCVIASYASDIKMKKRIERETGRQIRDNRQRSPARSTQDTGMPSQRKPASSVHPYGYNPSPDAKPSRYARSDSNYAQRLVAINVLEEPRLAELDAASDVTEHSTTHPTKDLDSHLPSVLFEAQAPSAPGGVVTLAAVPSPHPVPSAPAQGWSESDRDSLARASVDSRQSAHAGRRTRPRAPQPVAGQDGAPPHGASEPADTRQ